MHIHIYIYIYIYMYTCIHIYVCRYTYITRSKHIHTYIYIYTREYIRLFLRARITPLLPRFFTPTKCLSLALSLYLTGSSCWSLCPLGVGMSPILILQLVSPSILLLHCSIWEKMPRARESKNALAVRAGLFKLKSSWWLPGVENERNKTNSGKMASKKASEGRRREARN